MIDSLASGLFWVRIQVWDDFNIQTMTCKTARTNHKRRCGGGHGREISPQSMPHVFLLSQPHNEGNGLRVHDWRPHKYRLHRFL